MEPTPSIDAILGQALSYQFVWRGKEKGCGRGRGKSPYLYYNKQNRRSDTRQRKMARNRTDHQRPGHVSQQ